MPEIIVTLDKVLERLDITPYRLAKESKIRANTIYEILENKKKMINVETLIAILSTLNVIASEKGLQYKFGIGDIYEYIED